MSQPHRLREVVRREEEAYAAGHDRPVEGYAGAIAVYLTTVGALTGLARLTGRKLPADIRPWDVALLAAATHKFSRLVTKDEITAPIRAPFTTYEGGPAAPAETHESARGSGARQTVGKLLTCPFCFGMWTATGFGAGLVFAPRATKLAATVLATLAGSDFLHMAYAKADQASRG